MKTIQKLISYVFHPIVFPLAGSILYFIYNPKYTNSKQEYAILLTVFISTYILPLFFMYFLKHFKMIESFHLKTVVERKFPFIFFMTLSFLLGNMFYKTGFVTELAYYFFGSALALAIAYIYLLFDKKISLHTIAVSSLLGFMITLSLVYKLNLLFSISLLIVLTGMITTSRLYLKAHSKPEVLLGFIVGLTSQLLIANLQYIEF